MFWATRVSRYHKKHSLTHVVPSSGFYDAKEDNRGWCTYNPAGCHPIWTIGMLTIIPTIFTPHALPAATLPIYPGLGQATNMLACISSGSICIPHGLVATTANKQNWYLLLVWCCKQLWLICHTDYFVVSGFSTFWQHLGWARHQTFWSGWIPTEQWRKTKVKVVRLSQSVNDNCGWLDRTWTMCAYLTTTGLEKRNLASLTGSGIVSFYISYVANRHLRHNACTFS